MISEVHLAITRGVAIVNSAFRDTFIFDIFWSLLRCDIHRWISADMPCDDIFIGLYILDTLIVSTPSQDVDHRFLAAAQASFVSVNVQLFMSLISTSFMQYGSPEAL
jgi:hypothetical protein